jgi:hypothetical protein
VSRSIEFESPYRVMDTGANFIIISQLWVG